MPSSAPSQQFSQDMDRESQSVMSGCNGILEAILLCQTESRNIGFHLSIRLENLRWLSGQGSQWATTTRRVEVFLGNLTIS